MMIGIYCIKNKVNNKIYIGESLDIESRWESHIKNLNNNKHHSYKLQKEWNEYGGDNFEFKSVEVKLVEESPKSSKKSVLYALEYYYMCRYNSLQEGYNVENTFLKIVNGINRNKTMSQSQIRMMCFYVSFLNKHHKIVLKNVYSFLYENKKIPKVDFYNKFKSYITKEFLDVCDKGTSNITYDGFCETIDSLTILNCNLLNSKIFTRSFMNTRFKDKYDCDVVFDFNKSDNKKPKTSSPLKKQSLNLFENIPSESGVFYVENILDNKKMIYSSKNMNKRCHVLYKRIVKRKYSEPFMFEDCELNDFKFAVIELCDEVDLSNKLYKNIKEYKTYLDEYGYNLNYVEWV